MMLECIFSLECHLRLFLFRLRKTFTLRAIPYLLFFLIILVCLLWFPILGEGAFMAGLSAKSPIT
jgi:hypothetical protein